MDVRGLHFMVLRVSERASGDGLALKPRDRRELAKAGLAILAFGFVISPTVHAVIEHGGLGFDPDLLDASVTHGRAGSEPDHDETKPHSHDEHSGGRTHSHPDDSLEHLGACCAPSVWLPLSPQLVWALEELTPEREQIPEARRVRSPAMPQGP